MLSCGNNLDTQELDSSVKNLKVCLELTWVLQYQRIFKFETFIKNLIQVL